MAKNSYELTPDGIRITSFSRGARGDELVPFERIGFQITRFRNQSAGSLGLFLAFGFLAVFTAHSHFTGQGADISAPIIWSMAAIAFGWHYWRSWKSGVRFVSGINTVTLLGTRREMDSLADAIPRLKAEAIRRSIDRRLEVVPPGEVLRYLLHLRESLILDEQDYLLLRDEVELKSQPMLAPEDHRQIGLS